MAEHRIGLTLDVTRTFGIEELGHCQSSRDPGYQVTIAPFRSTQNINGSMARCIVARFCLACVWCCRDESTLKIYHAISFYSLFQMVALFLRRRFRRGRRFLIFRAALFLIGMFNHFQESAVALTPSSSLRWTMAGFGMT